MRRRTTILITIVVVVLIALGIVWETVPYVRYQLIPITGGTKAPQSLSLLQEPRQQRFSGHRSKPRAATISDTMAEDLS